MTNNQIKKIEISDYKTLIQNIKDNYDIDFSNYAFSSLKRRIELFNNKYYFDNFGELIYRINNDEKYFQLFLKTILIDATEMFRDSVFWDELKQIIVNKNINNNELKFWLPYCSSGEELYSLLILLDSLKLISKSYICVSSLSAVNVNKINEASLDIKNFKQHCDNFDRTSIGNDLFDFFIKKTYYAELNKKLFLNTNVINHNFITDKPTSKFDIILFRNKMLYFNQQLANKAIIKLKNALKYNGIIAIGVKENLNYQNNEKDFSQISETEKIFKKNLKE